MKKIILILTLLFSVRSYSQGPCAQTSCSPFLNSDLKQIAWYLKSIQTTTTPCTFTTCSPFYNSDLRQIYGLLGGLATPTTLGNYWSLSGNAVGSNTAFIGTTDNRSLKFKANNFVKMQLDSSAVTSSIKSNLTSFGLPLRVGVSVTDFIDIGSYGGGFNGFWLGGVNPTGTNYAVLSSTANGLYLNTTSDSTDIYLNFANDGIYPLYLSGKKTSGAYQGFAYTGHAKTKQTASANIPDVTFSFGSSQRNTGNITTNYSARENGQVITAVGGSTITNGYTHWFGFPIASTNMTITNKFGFGTDGSAHVTQSLVLGSSAHTPSAVLDVTGNGLITGSLVLGGATLTGGNTGTAAVRSDDNSNFNCLANGAISPADATTYYYGMQHTALVQSAETATSNQFLIPSNCTLIGYNINYYDNGVLASAENSTLSLRVNNTTDVQLNAVVQFTAASGSYTSTALSSSLTAGDLVNVKWVSPTWVTNPTALYVVITLYFKGR